MVNGWIILDKPHGLGSTQAVAAVKRNLGRVPPADWDGIHALLVHLRPEEWREGLTAFAEKRKPDYEPFWRK